MDLLLIAFHHSRAAEARLGFMTGYPNAYSTPSHRGHIAAVEGNLNSAKLAQREIHNQQKSRFHAFSPPSICVFLLFTFFLTKVVLNNRA